MGCCTNFLDFCRRAGLADSLRRDRKLHFLDPSGRRFPFAGVRWLPAPLHLAPALLRLGLVPLGDRLAIGRAMLRLARTGPRDDARYRTIGNWLAEQRQSPAAIERFWQVVLVSALSESLEAASLAAARQVFRDGFLTHRQAYEILVPTVPLSTLYGEKLAATLQGHGAQLHLGQPVEQVVFNDAGRASGLQLKQIGERSFDHVVLAVPWKRAVELLPGEWEHQGGPLRDALSQAAQLPAAPITAVHWWFDRPITPLPHAVIAGRLSQWLFARGEQAGAPRDEAAVGHYYQVVISASRQLAGRSRESIRDEVLDDLRAVFPEADAARVVQWRIVTQGEAVFAPLPTSEALRPPQTTSAENLYLAGDWTRTGWPATMEGAVRSGYLAAQAVLAAAYPHQPPPTLVQPGLPPSWLARWLLRASLPKNSLEEDSVELGDDAL